ncbi:MAG: Glycosyl transferase group 1 [Microgenomates group bacterium GW2011_GWA1_48_10]|nr:MAG: Glycosyl transferase group 1 [Microgenomates group bacterium GW2011_GWA1_48_10]
MKVDTDMKIVILTDAWTPIWGGGQKHIWEVSKRLTTNYDCQIDILVPNLVNDGKTHPDEEKYFSDKLVIRRLGKPFVFPDIFGRSLFLLFCLSWPLTHDYDIIHAHAYQFVLFPLLRLLRPRTKLVYTLHGAGVNLLGGAVLNTFKIPKLIWEFFVHHFPYDLLTTVAKSTIIAPVAAKKLAVVPNGVDTTLFDKFKEHKDPHKFKILWVGRIADPVKGVKYLEEAVEEIQRTDPRVKLSLVTNKFGDDLIKEYKSSDLFVLPSLSEGLPLTLLEAMAAKLPVVVTDVGDCKMIVNSAHCGEVVPPASSSSLAAAIFRMIDSKDRQKLGLNGYNFVKGHYLWDEIASKIYRAYQNV